MPGSMAAVILNVTVLHLIAGNKNANTFICLKILLKDVEHWEGIKSCWKCPDRNAGAVPLWKRAHVIS